MTNKSARRLLAMAAATCLVAPTICPTALAQGPGSNESANSALELAMHYYKQEKFNTPEQHGSWRVLAPGRRPLGSGCTSPALVESRLRRVPTAPLTTTAR